MQDTALDTASTAVQDYATSGETGADAMKIKPTLDGKGPERSGSGGLGEKGLPAPPNYLLATEPVDDGGVDGTDGLDGTVQKPTLPPKPAPPIVLSSRPVTTTLATDGLASKVGESERRGPEHGHTLGQGGPDGFGIALGKVSRAMKTGLFAKVGQGLGLGLLAPSPLPPKTKVTTAETAFPSPTVDVTPALAPPEGKGRLSYAALQHRRNVLVQLLKGFSQSQQHSILASSTAVDQIEGALDEMGSAIDKDDWFLLGLGNEAGDEDGKFAPESKRLPSLPLHSPLELLHQLSSSRTPQPSKTILIICSKINFHPHNPTSAVDQTQWKFLPGVFNADTDSQVIYGLQQLQQLFSSLRVADDSNSRRMC